MNIVDRAIERCQSQLKLAERLSEITGHDYKQGHVSYWKNTGYFPADLAHVIAEQLFQGEITAFEACPKIKQAKVA